MKLLGPVRWHSTYCPNLRTKLGSWKSLWKERSKFEIFHGMHMPCMCTHTKRVVVVKDRKKNPQSSKNLLQVLKASAKTTTLQLSPNAGSLRFPTP